MIESGRPLCLLGLSLNRSGEFRAIRQGGKGKAHSLMCTTWAGGKPLNHVAEALL